LNNQNGNKLFVEFPHYSPNEVCLTYNALNIKLIQCEGEVGWGGEVINEKIRFISIFEKFTDEGSIISL